MVIAIIAILAVIYSVFAQAREGQADGCLSNGKQMGLAVMMRRGL